MPKRFDACRNREIHPKGARVDILELFDDELPGNLLTAVFKSNRV